MILVVYKRLLFQEEEFFEWNNKAILQALTGNYSNTGPNCFKYFFNIRMSLV